MAQCEKKIVHFNNAGASPMLASVYDVISSHLQLEMRVGGYAAAEQKDSELKQVYRSVQKLIHCESVLEIALVESATVAWTRAFYAICDSILKPGEVILCSQLEYAANVVAMTKISLERNFVLKMIPSIEGTGIVDLTALDAMLHDDDLHVSLVCVTHIPTNSGLINPVNAIGSKISLINKTQRSKRDPVIYLVDACQSIGQTDINVAHMKCDAAACTGRKYLRGPRGTGFLFMKKSLSDTLIPSQVDHAAAPIANVPTSPEAGQLVYKFREGARRFEFWEACIANHLGLGAAVDHVLATGINKIQATCEKLADELRYYLRQIPRIKLYYDSLSSQYKQCGIVTFSIEGMMPNDIKSFLFDEGYSVSVVPATSTPFDSSITNSENLVRVSLSYFNTSNEIHCFCKILRSI